MELSAEVVARATGGDLIFGDPGTRASSFTIDSRLVRPGACFVALEAVRDGHAYVTDAFARGASMAIVRHSLEGDDLESDGPDPDGPVITTAALVRVPDQLEALAALGRWARERLDDATIVGVTGSAGKTATKDLIAAAVAPARKVHASYASYNNEAGLPLTLLDAPEDVEVVVTEMGARFAGNIKALTDIARPQIGVVTHVGLAHAGLLGGREGVARVKGELVEALPSDGLAVLNLACVSTPELVARTAAEVLLVGGDATADVRFTDVVLDEELRPQFHLESRWGDATIALDVRGEHQVENAAMAAAVALWLGVPIAVVSAGLHAAQPTMLRMELHRSPQAVTVLNDAYNSSPSSAASSLRSFAQLPITGRRIAVLGEMLELGEHAEAEHMALGALVAELGIDMLVAVGPAVGTGAEHLAAGAREGEVEIVVVSDADAAIIAVMGDVQPGDAVLVKASRAVGLELVAAALLRQAS